MRISFLHSIKLLHAFIQMVSLFFFAGCSEKKSPLFQSLSSSDTHITFQNVLPQREGLNILYYLYYYEGGGVATGDINNDGLPDIYFTANTAASNKLYLNKGNMEFEDITQKAGVAGSADWCSGVTMADINADGWLDLYVCAISKKSGLKGRNELFINNKNGTFSEQAADYGLDIAAYSCQSAFFDYDKDGDLDCYLLNQSDRPFQNITDTSNRRRYDSLSGDRLLRNDLNLAAKKFTDVSAEAGIYQSNLGYGLGLAVADFNNDGWDDVYVGNDFHENDYYYINNGNGAFSEKGADHFRHYSRFSMGNDAADFNNDGQTDIVTADMLPDDEKILKTYGSDENHDIYQFKIIQNGFQHQYSKNCLQVNNRNGSSYSETSLLSGVAATDWSWSALFADFDNDGNKDIFFTSGVLKRTTDLDYVRFISDAYVRRQMDKSLSLDNEALDKMPDGISHNYIFKGDGHLLFEDKSNDWGLVNDKGYFTGAAYADLDNDGDLDMIVNAIGSTARVYKNNTTGKNYLTITLKGEQLNTTGAGVKAWLFKNGKIQYLQQSATRGFLSAQDSRLHFGMGDDANADSLLIVWPSSKYQLIKSIKANQFLKIAGQDAAGVFDYNTFFPSPVQLFEEAAVKTNGWKHTENPIADFNVQYLIPQAKSTRGPKIAVADVNGDKRDDFYACGAKGQPGVLMIQQSNGNFVSSDTALFVADKNAEENAAIFFDANKDGFADLYVVTGGNEYTSHVPELLDRLYINDGKGRFTKSVDALPPVYENKSCVAAADADGDGDTDLFVGVHADAIAYGIPQTSYLLLNDGAGKFAIAADNYIDLKNTGMVTAAVFADVNNDKLPDMVIAGEWMPLIIFLNTAKGFRKEIVPNSTGWWQSLLADDVDGDGNMDLLAGNWGLNNKFKSGKDGPVKLYAADFDKNGRVDQLLSYQIKGKEFPFLAKDEVERQLPLLKKHYLRYSEYAGVVMKEVFYGWIDTIQPLLAERLGSVICSGDGRGGFSIKELPPDLQKAPVFCFEKIKSGGDKNFYIAGGNFYDALPYEGRYDAQPLALFSVDKSRAVEYIPQANLSVTDEQVRDIKWLSAAGGIKRLMIAGNNVPLKFFTFKNE